MSRPLLAVALAAWCAPLAAGELALPDNPLAGRVLFESKQCHQCHGLAGIDPGIAFDLGAGHFDGSFLDLGASLWNHVPSMSTTFETAGLAWPALSGEETGSLLSYLYFLDYLGRPGNASHGERLFRGKGCRECHTLDQRRSAGGPDLADLTDHASPLYVAGAIWNHGPQMLESLSQAGIPPPQFDDGDLADLAAFVRQSSPSGPRAPTLLAPGNPNRGSDLFRRKGCASCHGVRATGGDIGPDLTRADLHRSAEGIAGTMWNHALEMQSVMRQRGVAWPELEVVELADLAAYLYFLPFQDRPGDPARGGSVFVERACAECHAGGQGEAPDLAESGAMSSPALLVAAMWSHAPVMKEAIVSEGRHWPGLTGQDLRDLLAYLTSTNEAP